MDGRRDQWDKRFQVEAAGSGLGFQQPVSLLQVYNVRLLHCKVENSGICQGDPFLFQVLALFRNLRTGNSIFYTVGR